MPPAIVPPAPGRFSTTNCWPRTSDSLSAMMRVTMSVPPPAPKPIRMRTGLFGQSWAWALANRPHDSARVATAVRQSVILVLPLDSAFSQEPLVQGVQSTSTVHATCRGWQLHARVAQCGGAQSCNRRMQFAGQLARRATPVGQRRPAVLSIGGVRYTVRARSGLAALESAHAKD